MGMQENYLGMREDCRGPRDYEYLKRERA